MEIKQRFIVRHSPAVVWDALADAPFAVQCLPGAELDDSGDGRHYKGRMRVKLGPLAAAFAGDATVDRDAAAQTGTVEWVGVDSRSNSRAKAHMTYAVLPEGDAGAATAVQIDADIALTGALAQFGRSSIVQEVAGRLTAIFAENLQARLNATVAPAQAPMPAAIGSGPFDASGFAATAGPGPAPAPLTAAPPFQAADLRPLDLLLGVFRARLAARLRRWAHRLDPRP
jgi:carbon monoxide dehydrogenase subunit G